MVPRIKSLYIGRILAAGGPRTTQISANTTSYSAQNPRNCPLAVGYVALTPAQQRTYDGIRRIYADNQKQYSREQDALKEIKTMIQNTVPASKRPDLQPGHSVKQWLQKLKDSIRPSDGVVITKAKQKYNTLFKTDYQSGRPSLLQQSHTTCQNFRMGSGSYTLPHG